jgi:uncharacterized cupin superfamily protein
MSFSSVARRSLSAAGSKVVREQLQLVTERPDVEIGRVVGHVTEASVPRIGAVPNMNDPEFDDVRDQPGFKARRARLGRKAGAQRLGLSYWEIEPGQAAYPYHVHLTEEEMLVVLEGAPRLRTPDGWRDLEPGEVVSFAAGEQGAHQLVNASDSTVRFLAISTAGAPEILLQPDSGKLGARDAGSLSTKWFRESDSVPYFEGEQGPDV